MPLWQVSVPLHGSSSPHGVPFAGGVPAEQTPCWHVSRPLHALPSLHPEPSGRKTPGTQTPPWHTSLLVQGLPVLQLRPSGGGVPALQMPPWQVSGPLQALPSLHDVPLTTGACWQPNTVSHESTVHGLVSAHWSGVPGWQVPPRQRSVPLQTLPSAHCASVVHVICAVTGAAASTPSVTRVRSMRTSPPCRWPAS